MKLEYIPEGSDKTPLIRLFDFDGSEATRLREVFQKLANGAMHVFELHNADFVENLNDCQLTLSVDRRNRGITPIGEAAHFQCLLSPVAWNNIAGLTDPLTHTAGRGFQWLDEASIPLLLSRDGKW